MAAKKMRKPAIDLNPIDDLIDLGEYVVKETVRAVKGNKRPTDSSRGAGLRSSAEKSVRKIGTTTKRGVEESVKWTVGDPSKGWQDVVTTSAMNFFPYGKAAKKVKGVIKGSKTVKSASPVIKKTTKTTKSTKPTSRTRTNTRRSK